MTQKPLAGLKVVDLSRVLAGPAATQILGDFGADVIKIERPGTGDDTRKWGPPFVKQPDGSDSSESAYYLCANRSKRSIEIDFKTDQGLETLHKLIDQADILVENYKTGGLVPYGLDYKQLSDRCPGLIYASLTGFGQTGPCADQSGYDFMIQAVGGIMSVTGPEDGMPYKTGVAIADLMAGQYMLNGILAALYHREKTGQGQHIDISLFETQLAWLANVGQYYLTSGDNPPRMGNAHSTIVPYEAFEAADGFIVLAVGNDTQFQRFCQTADLQELSDHPDYATNPARVKNREKLLPFIRDRIKQKTVQTWLEQLGAAKVPCGPVNSVAEAFAHPQAAARKMVVEMDHPDSTDPIQLIANPVRFSKTPVTYDRAPPKCGEHTQEILKEWLDDTGA
ncbi:MAG: CaiB/BaiF CoA transferase family protein [Pseudomonadota bacterium]